MNSTLIIAGIVVLLISGGIIVYLLFFGQTVDTQALMGRLGAEDPSGGIRSKLTDDNSGKEFEALKSRFRKSIRKKQKVSLEDKFFRAGLFYQKDRDYFARLRIICPIITTIVAGGGAFYLGVGPDLTVVAFVVGALIGYQLPFSWLDRRILRRGEDILYFLPLVIEQIVVGVSASLDIGPCISTVVGMADERQSHNPVTDLMKRAQGFMKQGVPMEEALTELAILSGHTELKHSFMSLAQVARHGGEVTRQLQELADSVATQRETKIDGKIKKLELEATGPVALVFAGFLIIMITGFFLQLFKALK